MKEKLITLINILGDNSEIEGPFYIDDIIIDAIRICEGDVEFKIQTDAKCQFGEFEFWVIYNNMEEKHLLTIIERLANLL
jgi:hypothetical protein